MFDPGLAQWVNALVLPGSCSVGHRHGSYLALLWLWHRPVGVSLIKPLAWGLPYATGAAIKRKIKGSPTNAAAELRDLEKLLPFQDNLN